MSIIYKIILGYLALINVVTFGFYAVDKFRAINGEWRIRESTLLILAAVGGSIGALIAMNLLRHKIRNRKFVWGVPLIIFIQMQVVTFILLKTTPAGAAFLENFWPF